LALDVAGDQVLHAAGPYLFPGASDPRIYLELEVVDTVSSCDFYTGTVAAALAGDTAVISYA
jgi:dihydropyrimidinase